MQDNVTVAVLQRKKKKEKKRAIAKICVLITHQKTRDFESLFRVLRCVCKNVIASGACCQITFGNVGKRQRFYSCKEKHAAYGGMLQRAVGVSCGSTAKCSHTIILI